MKVILPLAGKGTRLLPLTRYVPKPLIRVAERPVMDYVMDRVSQLDIEEMIIITGHLREKVEEYVTSRYDRPARFVEQKVQDGTAGAINLARPYVDGPVLIIFVDTIFDADLSVINRVDADGIIWVKEVEDYQRFGVVVTDDEGNMTRIVEKPSEPISRLANIGLYYIRDWQTLYAGIEHALQQPPRKGEWFLTDAFQYMIDQGKKIRTAPVEGWYDCGKVATVLDTNRHLLESGRARRPGADDGVRFIDPVRIGDRVRLSDCTIGPNVTIEAGAEVRHSTVSEAIIGEGAVVERATVEGSLVGAHAQVRDTELRNMVATHDEVAPAP